MVTKEDLNALDAEFKAAVKAAERKRAETIARATAEGWAQKDIIEATGYSRETVRRITREGQTAADATEKS